MLTLLYLIPEFSIAALPQILITLLIIVLFAALVWYILSKIPGQLGAWAKWVAVVLGGVLLLWFLISLAGK